MPTISPSADRVRAVWNGEVLAESDRTLLVEGNHYFPRQDVRSDRLRDSHEHTFCPWKGTASYHDVEAGGERNAGAAWYYPEPMDAAAAIRDHVAFWRGVRVERV